MRVLPLERGFTYGPVLSRRLGRSLGINILPLERKVCSFNCVYCHYGVTPGATLTPAAEDFPGVGPVLKAVELALRAHPEVESLTFSGNGEPTLHPYFHELVFGVRQLRDRLAPRAQVTLFSNATALHLPQVQAALPAGAFKGFQVLPLTAPAGSRPLWAVFSTGLRNFELEPLPNHFLAIYTHDDAGWQELGRVNLDEEVSDNMAWPDYLDPAGVTQVSVEPTRVWLAVEGGAGAHGGTYHLLSFDGTTLRREISASAASPGVGTAQDLNGDGLVDIVLNQSDAYVFCYACGVRKIMFQVYTWDASNQRIREVTLQPFLMGQPQPLRDWVNPAVDLANAGLWKDALSAITQAQELVSQYPEADVQTLTWDYALIKLHAEALAQALTDSPYPLLANVFYGDDAAAVELMRAYSPDQLFTPQTPLIVGTVAEQWVSEVSSRITEATTAALAVKPDLAAAYFLRGWAAYLADPTSPQARADVRRAAELAPGDTLFVSSAAYLQ